MQNICKKYSGKAQLSCTSKSNTLLKKFSLKPNTIKLSKAQSVIQTDTSEKYVLLKNGTPHFFLKRIPDYAASIKSLESRSHFLNYLNTVGFPASTIIQTNNGKCFTTIEDYQWQIYKFIEGTAYPEFSKTAYANSMCLIEQFLVHSKNYVSKYSLLNGLQPNRAALFGKLDFFLKLSKQNFPQNNIFNTSIQLLETFLNNYSNQYHNLIQPEDLSFIHGDLSKNNILYQKNQPIALIDFDNAQIGLFVRDIQEFWFSTHLFKYKNKTTNFQGNVPLLPKNNTVLTGTGPNIASPTAWWISLLATYSELVLLGFIRGDYSFTNDNLNRFHQSIHCYLEENK